ncbi:MAG TPA: hypothetical protein VF868_06510 [Bacteroidia bacterium]|jgi:hypothetical protein
MKKILFLAIISIISCQSRRYADVQRYPLTVNSSTNKVEWSGKLELPSKSKEDIYNGLMAWTVKQSEPMDVLLKDNTSGTFKAKTKITYLDAKRNPVKGFCDISLVAKNGELEYVITNVYMKRHPLELFYTKEKKDDINDLNPVFESIDESMKNIVNQITASIE